MTEEHLIATRRLLVDYETGRVLRPDDIVVASERFLETHPFIARSAREDQPPTWFVGPDARRRALARGRGEGEDFLDAVEFTLLELGGGNGDLILLRAEDEK